MGRKAFCVPALVTSLIACVLLLLCTISTPTTFHTSTPFNFVQASDLGNITDTTSGAKADRQISAIKLGSWGYCSKGSVSGEFDYCSQNHHGYNVTLKPADNSSNNQAAYDGTEIKSSWTRGLVVVVVAFVAAIIGFILSFIPHLIVMLAASIVHLLAFILALIAFVIQIVLFVYTRTKIHQISNSASVYPGPAFYLTLISLPLLFFSALTVCCGWRKEKHGDALPSSYGSSTGGNRFSRFKFGRNKNSNGSYGGGEKIPLQSSRQRVLDAFQSDGNKV